MSKEPEYEDEDLYELIREMTNLAYSCLNCIETVFGALMRVTKRFPIGDDHSRFGWVLNGEITRNFGFCVSAINRLEKIYEPYQADPRRLIFAMELIKEANAELLEPISFKGNNAFTALEAVYYITDSFYNSDFPQLISWAEERVESDEELEDIGKFLDEFSEINDDFLKMLHFKLEQQQVITERAFSVEEREIERFIAEQTGTNTANSSEIKLPENPDVLDLCKMLKSLYPKITQAEVTRQFIGDAKHLNADSLLQQARRYRHLWHSDHI